MNDDYEEDFVGCGTWEQMTAWLTESLPEIPAGVTIDFGPKDFAVEDDALTDDVDDPMDAVCAQIVVLEHGRLLVRRSRVVMEASSFVHHDASAAICDHWFTENPTSDCTDGAIYVDDPALAADICVTWLSTESGEATPVDFGFDISEAEHLPGVPTGGDQWTVDDFLRRLGH